MIEALKHDSLALKCGGKFKLAALIQRRLKELVEGARPLVEPGDKTLIEIAIQEIAEDKIEIDREKTPGMGTLNMSGEKLDDSPSSAPSF